ncbi:MAG TPA: sugar nucleotide-binding protein [Gryllotalpicola sp.]
MQKWLVTGATGLLGANSMRLLGGDAVASARELPPQFDHPARGIRCDLTDSQARKGLVTRSGATTVLHAAALASIEACESDPELARELNVQAAADLAAEARDAGMGFVHISTDAVFDGRDGGYSEKSATNPQTVYARTKLESEEAVLTAHPGAVVARVNFYGWSATGRRGLAEYFYHHLAAGEAAPGFDDQRVSTLQVKYLIESLVAIEQRWSGGIVHVASSESLTKYEFGVRLATALGLDPTLVKKTHQAEILEIVRGSQLDLDTSLAESILGHPMPDQNSGFEELRRELDGGVARFLREYATEKSRSATDREARVL